MITCDIVGTRREAPAAGSRGRKAVVRRNKIVSAEGAAQGRFERLKKSSLRAFPHCTPQVTLWVQVLFLPTGQQTIARASTKRTARVKRILERSPEGHARQAKEVLLPRSGIVKVAGPFKARTEAGEGVPSRQRRLNSSVADATRFSVPSNPGLKRPGYLQSAATRPGISSA